MISSSLRSALAAIASVGLAQVIEEHGICELEVSITHGSTLSRSVGIWLHKEL